MIIKSPLKDYYDYVEHINGGDPNVLYLRNRLKPRVDHGDCRIPQHITVPCDFPKLPYMFTEGDSTYSFVWCVIAGKCYLLVDEMIRNGVAKPRTLVTPDSKLMNTLCTKSSSGYFFRGPPVTSDSFFGKSDQRVVELCRLVKQPVFVMDYRMHWVDDATDRRHKKGTRVPTAVIECELPILKDLGFASFIPATTMYQDIAYFMSNTIRTNPDNQPPVEVGNTDKITGHGFDIKQSFRHRKE